MKIFISKDLIKIGSEEYNNIRITNYDIEFKVEEQRISGCFPVFTRGDPMLNRLSWVTKSGVMCSFKDLNDNGLLELFILDEGDLI